MTPGALLNRVSRICLALPEASCAPSGSHVTYRVRKKVFAYFLNDHHGDDVVSVCCKMPLGQNEDLVQYDHRRFYLPAYIGRSGWVGIRLDLGKVDWKVIAGYVALSYSVVAPATLVAQLSLPQRKNR